jgi:hypothetical protein
MTQTAQTPNGDSTPKPSRFLTQLAEAAQRHGHSGATADAMAQWCRLFILFHGKKHPQEMGRAEIAAYLDQIARTAKDALGAIENAHAALEFLYGTYLQRQLGELPRPRPPRLLDQVKQAMRFKHMLPESEPCRRGVKKTKHDLKKFEVMVMHPSAFSIWQVPGPRPPAMPARRLAHSDAERLLRRPAGHNLPVVELVRVRL